MAVTPENLSGIQNLVLEIIDVTRNHQIPGSERHENVVEHSFSVSMLSWRLNEGLALGLDMGKVFKYCLVHDFPERGLKRDVSTFANPVDRALKAERERRELERYEREFSDFPDFVQVVTDYEKQEDVESVFVNTTDKMQAIILGMIDNWRPYKTVKPGGISYEEFCAKNQQLLEAASPYLQGVFSELLYIATPSYYEYWQEINAL